MSSTTAVCPRNRGMRSGSFPRSLRGMTPNAPPPPDSQLMARYFGLTWGLSACCAWGVEGAGEGAADLDQVGVPGIP